VRLLLDTHVLLWAVDDPIRLSPTVATLLQDPANDLLVSAATI
jgi:PIN domain nuclease of toxin-antitoxin system